MRFYTALVAGLSLISHSAFAQSTTKADSVDTKSGYAEQVWYSFANGEAGRSSKDNWDLAFEISGFTASIMANHQKGILVYHSPLPISKWSTLDTAGMAAGWRLQFNSDTSWSWGALSRNQSNDRDLGWGHYNMNTHMVEGDSIFVLRLADGSYRKLRIDNLNQGVYNFTYANLDGSDERSGKVNKDEFSDRQFAYFDLTKNETVKREPAVNDWDITFTRYTAFLPEAFSVSGVLINPRHTAAKAAPVAPDFKDFKTLNYTREINTIGYNWKHFDYTREKYVVEDSTFFYVKRAGGEIWRLEFTGFSSANGRYVFNTLKVDDGTGIFNPAPFRSMDIYPNPALSGGMLQLDLPAAGMLSLSDMNGKIISRQAALAGHNMLALPELRSGIYLVKINTPATTYTARLVIR